MTAEVTATGSVEATTALLRAELPQLEKQQEVLQAELAVVSERLESVRGALTALSVLSATNLPRPRTTADEQVTRAAVRRSPEPAADTVVEQDTQAVESAPADAREAVATEPSGTKSSRKARKATGATAKRTTAKAAVKQADGRRPSRKSATTRTAKRGGASAPKPAQHAAVDGSGLTDQVLTVLTGSSGTALRARDVAQAIGRDDSAGSINTVRSTLDRLVATSRVHRAGRGLYEALDR
ncbi:hypothetical protein V1460_16265 [Streptomyces sp. SCSIO 30461]|uniref:hypothetical protein n=1 Tax=Streptomyces sp. SCSIO 30461 TaxID=3118085 RepID=UPI0030CCC264